MSNNGVKLIAMLALFSISFLIYLGVFLYGWGLTPISWKWIIGGFIANTINYGLITLIQKDDK